MDFKTELINALNYMRLNAESYNYKDLLKKAEEVNTRLLDALADECPNYDSCSEQIIENQEPTMNEGYY